MAGGRPRTVSLSPDEMIKLGQEMCEWVAKNDPLHLSHWYSIEMFITDKDWDAMTRVPEFLPYYEKALKLIGMKYLDKNSNVREGASQRWQRVYFKDLRNQEDADLKYKAALEKESKKEEASQALENIDRVFNLIDKKREEKDKQSCPKYDSNV